MEGPAETIYVIDELTLHAGKLEAFLSAFAERYQPGAEARGQRLVHRLVAPPTNEPGVAHELVLIWALEGIPGFWGMRSQNATPEVIAWWADCDAEFAACRTRRFAADPDLLPALDAAGRVNA